jgi:hypothetical protein
MFAGLPPSSSALTERKALFRHLLLQIGGANIGSPPTSSSLGDEKHVPSLRVHCSLRSLRLALVGRCLPHSLADQKSVCSLARPGQRRASLAQHGGARSGVRLRCSARRGSRCGVRLLRRHSGTKSLSPRSSSGRRRAIRGSIASLRSARIALWSPPTSSSLGDEKHVPSLLLSTAARDPSEGTMSP